MQSYFIIQEKRKEKSSHKSMDLDNKDWNHLNKVDFNDIGNVRHIIKAKALLYDCSNSNIDKWSFRPDDLSYNSIA